MRAVMLGGNEFVYRHGRESSIQLRVSERRKGGFMPHYPYLIVGGGMAGQAAIQAIRELDAENPIGVLGQEDHRPYKRPPLSKGLWKGDAFDSIWYKAGFPLVEYHLG